MRRSFAQPAMKKMDSAKRMAKNFGHEIEKARSVAIVANVSARTGLHAIAMKLLATAGFLSQNNKTAYPLID